MKSIEIILTLNDEQRFWTYIIRKELEDCWLWIGCVNGLGYGRFNLNGKILLAHRIAYYLKYNVNPNNLCVCHHCDVPGCCNPRHLFLGTRQDNMQDAVKAGEHVTIFQPGPFGGNEPKDRTVGIEGPHYPKPHTWYATVTVKDGKVIKVT